MAARRELAARAAAAEAEALVSERAGRALRRAELTAQQRRRFSKAQAQHKRAIAVIDAADAGGAAGAGDEGTGGVGSRGRCAPLDVPPPEAARQQLRDARRLAVTGAQSVKHADADAAAAAKKCAAADAGAGGAGGALARMLAHRPPPPPPSPPPSAAQLKRRAAAAAARRARQIDEWATMDDESGMLAAQLLLAHCAKHGRRAVRGWRLAAARRGGARRVGSAVARAVRGVYWRHWCAQARREAEAEDAAMVMAQLRLGLRRWSRSVRRRRRSGRECLHAAARSALSTWHGAAVARRRAAQRAALAAQWHAACMLRAALAFWRRRCATRAMLRRVFAGAALASDANAAGWGPNRRARAAFVLQRSVLRGWRRAACEARRRRLARARRAAAALLWRVSALRQHWDGWRALAARGRRARRLALRPTLRLATAALAAWRVWAASVRRARCDAAAAGASARAARAARAAADDATDAAQWALGQVSIAAQAAAACSARAALLATTAAFDAAGAARSAARWFAFAVRVRAFLPAARTMTAAWRRVALRRALGQWRSQDARAADAPRVALQRRLALRRWRAWCEMRLRWNGSCAAADAFRTPRSLREAAAAVLARARHAELWRRHVHEGARERAWRAAALLPVHTTPPAVRFPAQRARSARGLGEILLSSSFLTPAALPGAAAAEAIAAIAARRVAAVVELMLRAWRGWQMWVAARRLRVLRARQAGWLHTRRCQARAFEGWRRVAREAAAVRGMLQLPPPLPPASPPSAFGAAPDMRRRRQPSLPVQPCPWLAEDRAATAAAVAAAAERAAALPPSISPDAASSRAFEGQLGGALLPFLPAPTATHFRRRQLRMLPAHADKPTVTEPDLLARHALSLRERASGGLSLRAAVARRPGASFEQGADYRARLETAAAAVAEGVDGERGWQMMHG